jgi:putative flippase GtrA
VTRAPSRLQPVVALLRRRELAFVLVGGINTVIGLAAFAVLYSLFPDQLHYLGALVLAYAIGTSVAFILHRRFVFRVRGRVLLDLVRFVMVQASSFGLNAALLTGLVEFVHVPVLPAQTIALALTVCASYFGHLLFSFRRPSSAHGGGAVRDETVGAFDTRRLDGHQHDRGAED